MSDTAPNELVSQAGDSEELFAKVFELAAHPMSVTRLSDGRYVSINAAGLAACGLSREQVLGRTAVELGFYDDPDQFIAIRDLIARTGQFSDFETRLRTRDGVRTYVLTGSVLHFRGEACLLTSALDITERKKSEERIRLLMREIDHRSSNLLSVVAAIVRSTVGDAAAAERLSQRIMSLAASNKLLVTGQWRGAELDRLVVAQLAHLQDLIGERIGFQGPSLRLLPAGAQAIGLALHELATNATKHGALSNTEGKIAIRWKLESPGDSFNITWREQDGPIVHVPEQKGFGHTVLVRMMESSLGGKARLEFPKSGLVWSFTCSKERVIDPNS